MSSVDQQKEDVLLTPETTTDTVEATTTTSEGKVADVKSTFDKNIIDVAADITEVIEQCNINKINDESIKTVGTEATSSTKTSASTSTIQEAISENVPSVQETAHLSHLSKSDMEKVLNTSIGSSATETTENVVAKKNGEAIVVSNDNDDEEEEEDGRIRLGICAMDKKARSKPMAEILSRLDENTYRVIFFGDTVLLQEPIHTWPVCDVLIAFYSKGYPMAKVKEYVKLHHPYVLNDLDTQEVIQDRRKVYDTLEASGIDVPRHVYLSRDGYVSTGSGDGNVHHNNNNINNNNPVSSTSDIIDNTTSCDQNEQLPVVQKQQQEIIEYDDSIVINGVTIQKPFVEKPVDAENHNIAIYYPTTAGGGCKKLFRKIGNRSSEFYPDIHEVRRDGSYIYEEFVETQGTDVKMYTVGPGYGHAEARKSPAVDGKVERNSEGKEVRFPVILTYREKEIARRIVLVFKQWICGFDILRVQEGRTVVPYVCDVNGFSFVKNSSKYYDDCAQILSEHLLATIQPTKARRLTVYEPLLTTRNDDVDPNRSFLSRAVRMLQGGGGNGGNNGVNESSNLLLGSATTSAVGGDENRSMSGQIDIDAFSTSVNGTDASTAAITLVDGALPVREFPNELTSEPASISHNSNCNTKQPLNSRVGKKRSGSLSCGTHQEELRCVLAIVRHGDRTPKQKLKLIMNEPHILAYFHNHSKDCKKDLKVKDKAPMIEFLMTVKDTLQELERSPANESLRYELLHMRDILERWKIVGLNRKLQIKPKSFEEYVDEDGTTRERCTSVQLILKWGGNLTRLGEKQSIELGQRLRHDMYPDANGGGILRLHSTFRHDLKIKTSDEGRVMKTAAAFAKGLLELEGDLPPILVSLVHKEKGSLHMLDPSGNKEVKAELDVCKEKISVHLQRDIDVNTASDEELELIAGPGEIKSIRQALEAVENPRTALKRIHQMIGELLTHLGEMYGAMGSGDEAGMESNFALSGVKLYKGETLLELTERWRFIYENLYNQETDTFDLSRIPDVHDNVRFDCLHNPHLGLTDTLHRLYKLSKNVADCVVPQEYGTTIEEKRSVGVKICHGLLEKIKYDLSVARTDNEVEPMRFMINTDYSHDLPINTMGRRIRTRLYFTSESHLHTVLNVLRFAEDSNGDQPILSPMGREIINNTPELCYLTHIVMRVFEDSRPEMQNTPRRFRVEVLFSPGATATPLHINEADRDADASRSDTAPLQVIGRDGLSCEELEAFFEKAITAGRTEDYVNPDVESMSTMHDKKSPKKEKQKNVKNMNALSPKVLRTTTKRGKSAGVPGKDEAAVPTTITSKKLNIPFLDGDGIHTPCKVVNRFSSDITFDSGKHYSDDNIIDKDEMINPVDKSIDHDPVDGGNDDGDGHKLVDENDNEGNDADNEIVDVDDDEEVDELDESSNSTYKAARKVIYRKVFWTTIAISSFIAGTGCIILAMRLGSRHHHYHPQQFLSRTSSSSSGMTARRWATTSSLSQRR